MKASIIAIAILSTIGMAHARNDGGPSNNNGPTFGGNTTVTANPSASAGAAALSSSSATGIGVGMGGAGGNASATGGAGGSATAVGLGGNVQSTIGNSVSNSVRNDVSSTNLNANTNSVRNDNANVQGQQQGQGQHQGQSQAAISGGNKLTNEGNNSAQSTSVTVEGDTYQAAKIPVATAYAAPLAASNGTCMGSSSGGAQGPGFGVSFGSTWTDSSCDMRYDAEALRAAGLPGAAQARLCQKPEIAAAMDAAGTPCPGAKKSAAAPAAPVTAVPAPQVQTSQYVGSDPIVMQRLGLAPLSK